MKKENECSLCQRVKQLQQNQYPYLIHEFENCYWLLGEHQYFAGYTVLLLKEHHKEMTELNPDKLHSVFRDLIEAQKIIEKVYKPNKMNLSMLGNVVPHVHWHLFPRYENDPHRTDPVWLRMNEFDQAKIDANEAQTIIKKIRQFMLG